MNKEDGENPSEKETEHLKVGDPICKSLQYPPKHHINQEHDMYRLYLWNLEVSGLVELKKYP